MNNKKLMLSLLTVALLSGCASGGIGGSFYSAAPEAEGEATYSEAPAVESEAAPVDDGVISETPRRVAQSGTLTAGDIDENLNYASFNKYVNDQLQGNSANALPGGATRRVTLRILGADRKPIGNARIRVAASDSEETVMTGYSATDGTFRFFPLMFSSRLPQHYTFEVSSPDARSAAVTRTLATAEMAKDSEVTMELSGTDDAPPRALDLVFVIDTTGSMGDELEYLKTEFSSIVASVSNKHPGVSIRYGLIVYRDSGDDYVVRSYDFTDSVATMQQQLDAQSANGGGDFPEAMEQAMAAAYKLQWRSGDVARALFLVADAPPHNENLKIAVNTSKDAVRLGVHLHAVAASGVDEIAEYMMRTMAVVTQGRYLFLTDDSGVGLSHKAPSIPCHVVTRLDRLIVRVLNSELSGIREEPSQSEIIRRVGNYNAGVCTRKQANLSE